MRENNADGFFPFTPAINLFFGLRESLDMMFAEGLENIFARHRRLGLATRAAVDAWGFETVCANHVELSDSVTAVLYPDGQDVEAFRDTRARGIRPDASAAAWPASRAARSASATWAIAAN